ncbi:hypothetical protein BKA93DRAFT_827136 [Sparassis latifolia]
MAKIPSRPNPTVTIPLDHALSPEPSTPPPEYTEFPIQELIAGPSIQSPRATSPPALEIETIPARPGTAHLLPQTRIRDPQSSPRAYQVERPAEATNPGQAIQTSDIQARYPSQWEEHRNQVDPRCRRGDHVPVRKYGLIGILNSIFCFPLGLLCLL